ARDIEVAANRGSRASPRKGTAGKGGRMSQLAAPLKKRSGSRPRVVIVGGGCAGLNAAKGLRRLPVDVTLIDRRNHHTFQPLLYQVALAVLSPADIAQPIRSIFSRNKNIEGLMDEVVAIEPDNHLVLLHSGAQ